MLFCLNELSYLKKILYLLKIIKLILIYWILVSGCHFYVSNLIFWWFNMESLLYFYQHNSQSISSKTVACPIGVEVLKRVSQVSNFGPGPVLWSPSWFLSLPNSRSVFNTVHVCNVRKYIHISKKYLKPILIYCNTLI